MVARSADVEETTSRLREIARRNDRRQRAFSQDIGRSLAELRRLAKLPPREAATDGRGPA